MPFDGLATKCIVHELKEKLLGAKIQNVYMPEKDEVLFLIHNYGISHKLVVSVNPSCSRIHLTDSKKENPQTPPNFCMFLRKHIASGRIADIRFHDYERLIDIIVEVRSELGDMQLKRVIVELTGRNCNLIVTNENNIVIDALKHVDEEISSKRQIMPAREYRLPPEQDKVTIDYFTLEHLEKYKGRKLESALLSSIKGFSPSISREICQRAMLDEDRTFESLSMDEKKVLLTEIHGLLEKLNDNVYSPCLIYENRKPRDFYPFRLSQYNEIKSFSSFNEALDEYYTTKDNMERILQKQGDIRRIINHNIDRCQHKIVIHQNNVNNQEKLEKYRLYGELITANIYRFDKNSDSIDVLNYYTNEVITIPIEKGKDANYNSQQYFKKYKKAKSAALYSREQLEKVLQELSYLESTLHNLSESKTPEEVDETKEELIKTGYIKKQPKKNMKKQVVNFRPLTYISSEGYEIFVGRNNLENDYLTFKFANSRDLWLHAQKIPGSHVIIRKKDKHEELFPDRTITEAAIIAAYHSRAKNSGQIAVDYSEIKNIKKPNGAPPGLVNYFTYYSAYVTADEGIIKQLKG